MTANLRSSSFHRAEHKMKAVVVVLLAHAAVHAANPTCSEADMKEVIGLSSNMELLDAKEKQLAQALVCAGQQHLFTEWNAAGESDGDKHKFFSQVSGLDASYPGAGQAMFGSLLL